MDDNQARTRIIEVGQLVKKALVARGVRAEEKESSYKISGGVARLRSNPFWSEEAGFKYIDDVDSHLRRLVQCFELLNPRPGSSVFEIGPGSCYFLFMCRELRGCRVAGVDWIEDEAADRKKALRMPYHDLQKHAFRLFREHFGLDDVVQHQVVKGLQPIDFGGRYDAIVATSAMFNRGWGEESYRFWLRDCHQHLEPEGRLMIALNKVRPDALAALPGLRPECPPPGNEKLTIIARAAIGQILNGERTIPNG
jgi:hypothetical protein